MEPGRWARITDIYHATLARQAEERASFLGEQCKGDEGLRKQVEAMLTSHEQSGDFIESPAFEVAPELLLEQPAGELVGQLIGHYRIESLIGVGGMGEVYLARDELLGRKVALKLLLERLTLDETQLSRFKTEARSASALNHPNILTVHEIGAEGHRHFIATEFIEGMTLRASLTGREDESARRAGNCRASGLGAGGRARSRRCTPRHQTGEHHAATGRIREGARLRDCQTYRAKDGIGPRRVETAAVLHTRPGSC
jgi:hypothetical protein